MNKITQYWVGKSQTEIEVFNKFICAWIAFNSIYGLIDDRTERGQIEKWSNLNLNIFNSLKGSSKFSQATKMLTGYEITRRGRTSFKCSDHQDYKGILLSLYYIRCNLMHGRKEPGDEIDARYVSTAYNVLNDILVQWQKNN